MDVKKVLKNYIDVNVCIDMVCGEIQEMSKNYSLEK